MRVTAWGAAAFAALVMAGSALAAEGTERPRLYTNQDFVEDATRATSVPVADLMGTFTLLFGALADEVKVYPTENYYYFGFYHNGIRYAGNIRLDASNRDDGKLDFAYFEDTAQWFDDSPIKHEVLDAARGVTVEKIDRLVYRVSYQGKGVVFALNDLSKVRPP